MAAAGAALSMWWYTRMDRCSSPTTRPAPSTALRTLPVVRHRARRLADRVVRCGWLAAFAAVACSTGDRGKPGTESTGGGGASAMRTGALIRVTFAPDSAAAVAFADSLGREGWEAESARRASRDSGWAVRVIVPGDAELAKLAAHALRQTSLEPLFLGIRSRQGSFAVGVIPVNRGSHGMSARIRWTSSDDRRAVLVVEDPRAVENEPVPNGFVFASEGTDPVQRDSVWDVAPSPDWRSVAYARAYTASAGETDSIPPREWHRLAGSVGLMESVVRKNVFPTSGMVTAYGVARPFVVRIARAQDSTASGDTGLPIAEGWRVAWTRDGSRLAIGAPPKIMADDAPASRWRLVDPGTGASRGVADSASLAQFQWVQGPSLDVSTAVDMRQRRAFRAGDVDIESEDGWIRVYTREGARIHAPRIVGPGIALTATANGRFIAAIAPDPGAKSYDPPNSLVVYHILSR
jgi:hypothetical protein